MSQELIKRLQDESDLCRNEGADDIARLLHKAAWALHEQAALIEQQAAEIERLQALLRSIRSVVYENYRDIIDAELARPNPVTAPQTRADAAP